jgi:hypothetical protein
MFYDALLGFRALLFELLICMPLNVGFCYLFVLFVKSHKIRRIASIGNYRYLEYLRIRITYLMISIIHYQFC